MHVKRPPLQAYSLVDDWTSRRRRRPADWTSWTGHPGPGPSERELLLPPPLHLPSLHASNHTEGHQRQHAVYYINENYLATKPLPYLVLCGLGRSSPLHPPKYK